MFGFDKIQDLVTEYVYSHNSSEDTLDIQVGSENALFKKSYSYRRNSSGYQIKTGGEWKSDSEAYIPKLNEYFFGTENHGGMLFECQEASMVSVNGKDYTCELWLMEDNSGSKTVYTTIYRYFNGSRLAGVRILFDFDKLMEVYDVKSYTIG